MVMKAIRTIFSIAVIASLAISLLPEAGKCQMMYGGILMAGCQMPCCKTKLPMPKCAMIMASAPRDFIAITGPVFEAGLQQLYTLVIKTQPPIRSWSTAISDLADTFELLFIGPARPIRAPPSNVHLLAA